MKHPSRGQIAAAVMAATLAAPVAANAESSLFSSAAKVIPAGQTPDASWTQSSLGDEARYFVDVNGFPLVLKESNGVTGGGIVDFNVLPSAYRNLFSKSRWLDEGSTGAQAHATCDVAALDDPNVILGWQGDQPAYGYIPFQATSAGLGDDPASWLAKLKAATGLTLTATTDLAAACKSLGGTFAPADAVVATPASLATGLTAPLQAKIDSLTAAKAASDATAAKAQADVKRLALEASPFKLTVDSNTTLQRGLKVTISGPPNRPVFIRALVSDKQRRQLKIPFKTLGTGSGATDAAGKGVVIVQGRKDTAPVLLRWQTPVPVTLAAVSGDRQASPIAYLGA
jgi:hypothetical protein